MYEVEFFADGHRPWVRTFASASEAKAAIEEGRWPALAKTESPRGALVRRVADGHVVWGQAFFDFDFFSAYPDLVPDSDRLAAHGIGEEEALHMRKRVEQDAEREADRRFRLLPSYMGVSLGPVPSP